MLNAHLPRQGKDIPIKPIWDNPSDTLTLRWNGRDTFIFDGAAERYRKPAKSNEVALFARAYFYQTPQIPDLSDMKDAPLYDAPNGIITRRLTPAEQQDYLIMLTCVRGDWAEIAYIQPGDRYPVDLTRSLRQGRDYATGFRRASTPSPHSPRAASMRWRTCETASRWRSHFTSWKPATAGSRCKWPPPTTSAG